MDKAPDHWSKHAQQWQRIGAPLRPVAEDIQALERVLECWYALDRLPAPQAMLLGVTPEIALMRWPPGTRLVALDRSRAMINEVWPSDRCGYTAVCAQWSAPPLADSSQDIIVGDGCFGLLANRAEYQVTLRALRRVISEHGIFVMRFFIRPDVAELVAAVFDDLRGGRIGNFHVFKWRLAMALHGSFDVGVRLADIWDAWRAAVPEPEPLAARLGWPLSVVLTIDAYRGVATRYTFPTLAEARLAMAEAFSEIECFVPGYELGERCPTLAFRPR